jgi:hypothetical protein
MRAPVGFPLAIAADIERNVEAAVNGEVPEPQIAKECPKMLTVLSDLEGLKLPDLDDRLCRDDRDQRDGRSSKPALRAVYQSALKGG